MRPDRFTTSLAALGLAWIYATGSPLRAEERWLLHGLFDIELWNTDPGSRLLARDGGDPAFLGRLRLWTAVDLHSRVRLVAVGKAAGGDALDDDGVELEQAFLRLRLAQEKTLQLDIGRFPAGLGNFSERYSSTANPLIGDPDTYSVAYPEGVQLSGGVGRFDFRAGMVDLPLVNERYVPAADRAWRPALAVGVTPRTGLRLGLYGTAGPYLGSDIDSFLPPGARWRDFDQRIVGFDLRFSRGYFELNADIADSSYEVPTLGPSYDGLVWYVEPKYTWTPRWFTAMRYEVNDYAFISPDVPTWTASTVLFRDIEVGVGYRFGPETVLKASYRIDRWDVEGFLATILPDGHAFALQFSRRFDARDGFGRDDSLE